MKYEDLLGVPYKTNGRDMTGMDCYGLVLECCKRSGKNLHDIVYADEKVEKERLTDYVSALNVIEATIPKEGLCVQCEYQDRLHIGYMVNSRDCIHATYYGVQITPVAFLKNVKYFEVGK